MEAKPHAPLSLFDATMLVMGGVVGVGIFFTPQSVARLAPSSPTFFLAWIVGGVIALAGAMTFAELAGTFPHAGGWFVFLREAFGRFPAFLFAWVTLLVISTGATAVVADFCSQQVATLAWGAPDGHEAARRAIGAALIVGVTLVCLAGVKPGALFQDGVMLVKLAAVATLVVAGLALAARDLGGSVATTAGDTAPNATPSVAGFIRAMLPVLFAYGGWQLVTYIAPSVRDPHRNVPRALVIGMAGVVLVYVLVNVTYVRVLGIDGLATTPGFAAVSARRILGDVGGTFLVAAMAASALGICAAILLASPALYVAMARDGLFFASFGRVHPRTGAPTAAILVQGVVTLAYFLWGRAGPLTDAVVFAEWIFHALCGAALLTLRHRRTDLPRPFTSPGYPAFPIVYTILATLVVLGSLVTTPWATTRLGLGVLAVGAAAYLPWRRVVRAGSTSAVVVLVLTMLGAGIACAAGDAPESAPRGATATPLASDAVELVLRGEGAGVSDAQIRAWIERARTAVTQYYGRFPVVHVTLLVTKGGRFRIAHGVTYGGRRIRIDVGALATEDILLDDWRLTHEMFHLGFPDLDRNLLWMEEGLATYLEPIARARVGQLTPERVWGDMVDGMPHGLPASGDTGLDSTPTWGRTYWGGALFWLQCDVAIRERTHGAKSLDDAIRAILAAGGDGSQHWTLARIIEVGDHATGTTVLADMHATYGMKPTMTDLDALWKRLGVGRSRAGVTFDEHAPDAAIRDAITAQAPRTP